MVCQVNRKYETWNWSKYMTIPAALDVKIVSSIEQRAAAIVEWKIKVDGTYMEGNTAKTLINKFHELNDLLVGKVKLILFCKDLDVLEHFLSVYVPFEKFDCNGKGLAIATYNHIELRDVKFIASNWKDYSDEEHTIDKLYEYADYYMKNVIFYRKGVLGKTPITPHQVITSMMRQRMTDNDHMLVESIFPKTKAGYLQTKEKTFIGGYCGCTTIEDLKESIGHVDFTTSYIAQALTNYYPMSRFVKADIEDFKSNLKNKCCLINVTFYNFKAGNYIFVGKKHAIDIENPVYSQISKILSADKVTFLVTEMDFELLSTLYDFTTFEINEYFIADRAPLPEYVTSVAQELYMKKATALKDTPEREWAKTLTEHVYGAMDSPIYGDKDWFNVRHEAVASPYWAIWMISHARFALMTTAATLGKDFIYADTDSLFFKNPYLHVQLIEQYNRAMQAKVESFCLKHDLDFEVFKELGTFKYEDEASADHFTIVRFKACGPKRYMYVYNKKTDYQITRKIETKIAGYAKQYKKDGELVNVWLNTYDNEDDLFEAFDDHTKIVDYQKVRYFSTPDDKPCHLIYDGKMYTSEKYVLTYYRKTNTSATEKFTDLLTTEKELAEHQAKLGKIKIF